MRTTTTCHWNTGGTSLEHNTREEGLCRNEKHIDLDNKYGYSYSHILVNKTIRQAYEEIFGEALEEYNAGQKRKDRQMTIDDYIKNVEDDSRGKKRTKKVNGKKVRDNNAKEGKKVVYEFTVGVGNTKNDCAEELPRELQDKILQQYFDTFTTNNPAFKLVSVARHGDEGWIDKDGNWNYGIIHDHYVIVPVGTGYEKGLSIQNSMNKALSSMGIKGGDDVYDKWAKKQKKILEGITYDLYSEYCKNHPDFAQTHGSLEIYHPVSDEGQMGDMTKEQYIRNQELDEKAERLEEAKQELVEVFETKQDELNEQKSAQDALKKTLDEGMNAVQDLLHEVQQYQEEVQQQQRDVQQQQRDVHQYQEEIQQYHQEINQYRDEVQALNVEMQIRNREETVAEAYVMEMERHSLDNVFIDLASQRNETEADVEIIRDKYSELNDMVTKVKDIYHKLEEKTGRADNILDAIRQKAKNPEAVDKDKRKVADIGRKPANYDELINKVADFGAELGLSKDEDDKHYA